jgi:hypothetical protein
MFSTEKEAKALALHLVQFARGQSVLVAPGSQEDQARIAALNTGERSLAGPSDGVPAAQLQRELRTAAALGGVEPPSILDIDLESGAPPPVRCAACGTAAQPHARFCAHCGKALT